MNVRCPNCNGKTKVVGAGIMKARICETAGCVYPDRAFEEALQ